MKLIWYVTLAALLLGSSFGVSAQNNRLNIYENIGWFPVFFNIKLTKQVGIHADYQWRRYNYVEYWQQSLFRTGINYQPNPKLLLRAGYGWSLTFAYGEIPQNKYGKNYNEHRLFEMLQYTQKEGRLEVIHRYMFEQRYVGKFLQPESVKEDTFVWSHRFRYLLRLQMPLTGHELKDKVPYAVVYDEIFIGFGRNVQANVFDQNRFGMLLGYRFNKHVRLEGGFFNQIQQFGREVDGKNVFQYNTGFILNSYWTIGPLFKEH